MIFKLLLQDALQSIFINRWDASFQLVHGPFGCWNSLTVHPHRYQFWGTFGVSFLPRKTDGLGGIRTEHPSILRPVFYHKTTISNMYTLLRLNSIKKKNSCLAKVSVKRMYKLRWHVHVRWHVFWLKGCLYESFVLIL